MKITKTKSSIFYTLVLPILSILVLLFSKLNFISFFSFLILFFSIQFLIVSTINLKNISITNISLIVFSYLFFFIAPVFQFNFRTETILINTLKVDNVTVLYSNVLLSIFLIIYTLSYKFFFKNQSNNQNLSLKNVLEKNLSHISLSRILIIITIFLIIFLSDAINEILTSLNPFEDSNENQTSEIKNLLIKKFIYLTPLLCAITAYYNSSKNKFYKYFIFILCSIVLILFKNPLVEHRNGFGIPYLILFICVFPGILKTNVRFLNFLFLTMLVMFPLGSFLAPHRDKKDTLVDEFLNLFNTVHFDAWANFIATVDYVKNEGIHFGQQLISTLGFWIPRDFWVEKSVASGLIVGDYLIDNYSFWFNNISLVFPGEGYIDFGFLGLLLYSIILGYLSSYLDKKIMGGNNSVMMFSLFIAFSYLFLFRGPLLSSLAFSLGGAFAFYFFIKLVNLKFRL